MTATGDNPVSIDRQPRPSSPQPDYTLLGLNPITAMQGQTTDEAPTKPLT